MSFVITTYIREGIVMASDSRLSLNREQHPQDNTVIQIAISHSDSVYKTFLAPNNVGISTCGDSIIDGVPVTSYVEVFIDEVLKKTDAPVDAVPAKILQFFKQFPAVPNNEFLVAGYKDAGGGRKEQQIWSVDAGRNEVERVNAGDEQGCSWRGDTDVFARILQPLVFLDANGNPGEQAPTYQVPYGLFSLQDAIDFSVFAVQSTMEVMRFQSRAKTVGGPIDVLVIKPDQAFWVQRKELHA